MINKKQLELYIHLDGNIDMYARLNSKLDPGETLEADQWRVIDDIVQRLIVRHNKWESARYSKETDELLKENIESDEDLSLLTNYCLNLEQKTLWWKFW